MLQILVNISIYEHFRVIPIPNRVFLYKYQFPISEGCGPLTSGDTITFCSPMRAHWNSVFPERFLPPPVPDASDRKVTDHFAGLWQRIAISSKIKDDLAYNACYPSVEKDITRRRCQDCNIYFTSMATVQRHRLGKAASHVTACTYPRRY